MCRHIAALGPPLPLGELLIAPEHGLLRQSWAPRRQRHGTVNADGFGVGWYADGDPVPARYRRAGPIWGDLSFADLARVVRSRAVLAAVRDATLAGADGEAAAAPFAGGPWLFSHNGAVSGWPGSLAPLVRTLPADELLSLEARSDSALLWALVLRRLRDGDGPGQALADTVREVAEAAPGSRLNFLLTDGETIAATAWGDSLWSLAESVESVESAAASAAPVVSGPAAATGLRIVVASEPYDDDPRWREAPDRTLLVAGRADVLLSPLKEPAL
ncbi:ergothioneine biosynthesis protein EgtC [Streptomyces jumonjinensis]|uniref:Gamma-glutamyl-hercynylcysteine sulfoxide hydrolase n=1 Tax=Streptomyces jumonjinensis TaxID=1945 RepID=A0A646KLZ5_STRJU|nr:ergothioneine biosynthesis protein EgtC [Streptomyces jumonjinensis]MQT01996.1 ergothioneine biosynthesis protein EgtC [Streptomyces jumonjinensis]